MRIRLWPSLKGKHLGFLKKDQAIEILDRTDEKMKVGEWNNYWYKVRTSDGLVGWSYGEFIKRK